MKLLAKRKIVYLNNNIENDVEKYLNFLDITDKKSGELSYKLEKDIKKNKKLLRRLQSNLEIYDKNFIVKLTKLLTDNEIYDAEYINLSKEIDKLFSEIVVKKQKLNNQLENQINEIIINIKQNKSLLLSVKLMNVGLYNKLIDKKIKRNDRIKIYALYQRIFFKVSPFADYTKVIINNNQIQDSKYNITINNSYIYTLIDKKVYENIANEILFFNNNIIVKNNNYYANGFINNEDSLLYRNQQCTLKFSINDRVISYLLSKYKHKSEINIKEDRILNSNIKIVKLLFKYGILIKNKPSNPKHAIQLLAEYDDLGKKILSILENKKNNYIFKISELYKILPQNNLFYKENKLIYLDVVENQQLINNFQLDKQWNSFFDIFNENLQLQKNLSKHYTEDNSECNIKNTSKKLIEIASINMEYYKKFNHNFFGYYNFNEISEVNNLRKIVIDKILKEDILSLKDFKDEINVFKKNNLSSDNYNVFGQQQNNKLILNHVYSGSEKYISRFKETQTIDEVDFPITFGFNANIRPYNKTIHLSNGENLEGNYDWTNLNFKKTNNEVYPEINGKKVKLKFLGTLIPTAVPPILATLIDISNQGHLFFSFTELLLRNDVEKIVKENIYTLNRKTINNVVVSRKTWVIFNNPFFKEKLNLDTYIKILTYFKINKLPMSFYLLDIRFEYKQEYMKINKNKPFYINLKLYDSIIKIISLDKLIIQENYPHKGDEYVYEI